MIEILIRIQPDQYGEFLKTANEVKEDLETVFAMLSAGGESAGYGIEVIVQKE